jgi:DNA-binding transcriptional LysR family regulator
MKRFGTAVESGAGATLISEMVVASQIEAVILAKSDLLRSIQTFKLISHRDRHQQPAMNVFVKLANRGCGVQGRGNPVSSRAHLLDTVAQ